MALQLFLGFVHSPAAAKGLHMVYFDDYAPFSFKEQGQVKGVAIQLVDEMAKRMNIGAVIHEGWPWARAQVMVKDGAADGFITVPTTERFTYAEFGFEPAVSLPFKIFVGNRNPNLVSIEQVTQLDGLKSFRMASYIGAGWANQNKDKFQITFVPNVDDVFRLLAFNRVDVFVDAGPVSAYKLRATEYSDLIVELPLEIGRLDYHFGLGKKSLWLTELDRFNQTLRAIKNDGLIEQWMAQYTAAKS